MFNKIVNFFTGNKQPEPESTINDKLKDRQVTEVTGVTVKAVNEEKPVNKYTKKTLEKMTKLQLEDLGRSEFGVELDRRLKKDDLVKQLLNEQRQANKKG